MFNVVFEDKLPLLIMSVIALAFLTYALLTRKKAKSKKILVVGISMFLLGLIGFYFGMFHGILSQTWLLADEGVTISNSVTTHGQKVILLGMILSVTSSVILVLGLLTLSINKRQVLFPQAK